VRWVMGESSAKHLRGESMADVIFNGSTGRKPVGQATIELVFDNSEGKLGGEYANFNEIAIKRTVTRDGQSLYHLNGTRCRRRDITDIFLGTGLGPRSYAIIEQGTISRLIEAKPEELRVFLEEAAGISKYKERRRETETRIKHTRENLDRLSDLRDELEKQLARLKRQANTAEKYKVLREEERLLKAQLTALRWLIKQSEAEKTEAQIREQETALESAIARQRSIEAEIESQRESHTEASDKFNEVQSRFYSVGTDIAKIEQSIQHAKERRQQQQQDLNQLEQDWQEAHAHFETDQKRLSLVKADLAEVEPKLEHLQSTAEMSSAALSEAESAMQAWQSEWDSFSEAATEPARNAEVERTHIQHVEEHLQRQKQRLERLQEELQNQSHDQLISESGELEELLQKDEAEIQQSQAILEEKQSQIGQLRDSVHLLNTQLDESRGKLQDLRGRSASLEALQQAALGKEEGAVTQWLNNQHLQDAPRLAEELEVEDGWAKAAECVLGENLEAVCVDGVDPLVDVLESFDEGTLTLFDTRADTVSSTIQADSLESKIKAPWKLTSLLKGVLTAENLQQALSMRGNLSDSESVVTREGIWLGKNWLRVARDKDEKAGILQREQTLKTLAAETNELQSVVLQTQQQLETEREQLATAEMDRDGSQATINQLSRQRANRQSDLSARKARLEQMQTRKEEQRREAEEVRQQVEKDNTDLAISREKLEVALEQMSTLEEQRVNLQQRRDVCQENLSTKREQARVERDAAHEIKVRIETLRAESNSTEQALARMQERQKQLAARRDELQTAREESDAPIDEMNKELDVFLASRIKVEEELSQARTAVETIDHHMRELEEARSGAENGVQEVRSGLESIRIGWQEVKVRRQTLEEAINETRFELKTLIDEMPEDANEFTWEQSVDDLEQKIQRLGPINLAAIEEYEQEAERKKYLDEQDKDLTDALTTLENAIAKIDSETRTRFKETFDRVNSGVKELFPRLFGGGHAYLELTDDNLLDAGVTIMARPPGKRNSTIHLLSGGEKALTAVSLVFSIFQLNPAPFCMLDEVDAPLDDANVGRFCDMVKYMSDKTQFIFITHNKITMEISQHLTGVTMHEPGVSRLVAVDVEAAAELASA
ncbi:MAG: chromosome segregation protein SMC, partial [Gammaproteobacteria bacterium]|nr:chromosome segregation protein SMC [Gammaproteobacteria bacterium]